MNSIPGFPHYLVSPDGKIYSRRFGRPLRSASGKDGYVRQPLVSESGKPVCVYVHRIVAQTYVPNPDGLPEVDHKNGDRSDNRSENLHWVSHRENIRLAMARSGNWLAKLPRRAVPTVAINPTTGARVRHASGRDAAAWVNAEAVAAGGEARPVTGIAANISAAKRTKGLAYGFRWQ